MSRLETAIEVSAKENPAYFGGQNDDGQLRHHDLVQTTVAAMNRETDMYNDALLLIKHRVKSIVAESGKQATRNPKALYEASDNGS